MLTKPLLDINGLSAVIGRQPILKDISLSIPAGGWFGVVGGSGAGKSTLLRVIMGLRRPARPVAGRIAFDGLSYDMTTSKPVRVNGIAYVPQSPAHGLDPLRQIAWQWGQLARCKRTNNPALFEALGLPEPKDSFPHEWSTGMQQRLLLAMALMEEPKLLILDEPTSALDALIAAQVLREVEKQARDKGVAVMMVTHDLALAARFSDDIAIMENGRIVESGPAQTILSAPTNSYARELVANRHWKRAVDA